MPGFLYSSFTLELMYSIIFIPLLVSEFRKSTLHAVGQETVNITCCFHSLLVDTASLGYLLNTKLGLSCHAVNCLFFMEHVRRLRLVLLYASVWLCNFHVCRHFTVSFLERHAYDIAVRVWHLCPNPTGPDCSHMSHGAGFWLNFWCKGSGRTWNFTF